MGTFSFEVSKNLNTCERGIVIPDDARLADTAWSLMSVSRVKSGGWYDHPLLIRLELPPDRVSGSSHYFQMERLENQMKARGRKASYLSECLLKIGGVRPLVHGDRMARHPCHLYIYRYRASEFSGLARKRFLRMSRGEGVPTALATCPRTGSRRS